MNTPIAILGIAGSLRKGSYNRAALRAAERLAPEGARLDIFDLAGIPPFNQDDEKNPPPRVVELKRSIRAADAILLVTPSAPPAPSTTCARSSCSSTCTP